MKQIILIVLIVVVIAAGAFLYFKFGAAPSPTGQNGPSPIIPVPTTPIPASSYGSAAVGSTSSDSSGLVTPKQTDKVGMIQGVAKLAAGSATKFSSVKIGVYDPQTSKLLATSALSDDGSYQFIVEPGEYIVNFAASSGSSPQLPSRYYVGPGETIDVNFLLK